MGAVQYAEIIDRHLNSCEYLDPRPIVKSKIQIPPDNPNSHYWKEKFFLRDDKVLTVQDAALFDAAGNMTDRSFSYDFRDKGSEHPIWRVCNHNDWQPSSAPCHVHVGHDDNQIDCFPDSHQKDFTYAMHCVKNYYLQKPQDWEKAGDDESCVQSSGV